MSHPSTPRPTTPQAPLPAGRLRLVILAMSLGAFAIGTTEFASMGLLPQIARDLEVSIPQAGMLITLYALGVVIGAPLVTIAAVRLPRARLLMLLIALIGVGNLLSAMAPDFTILAAARFVSGLPHGAFFGVASLVAARLSPPGQRARSVSLVMLGLTIATMLGVPASTAFGQIVGWRSAYIIVVLVAAVSTLAIWRLVPEPENGGVTGSIRGELRALRRAQVWFALGIGSIGFGGMFAVYSYIGEIVPGLMGLGERAVPVALFVFGVGMTAGNILAGRLADRSIYGTIFLGLTGMALSLAIFALVAQNAIAGMVLLLAVAVTSQLMGPSLQLFLLDASPDAPSLAAALHHSALNIGNSLGAALGAAVLAAGWGLAAPSWTGVVLAVLGLGIAGWSFAIHRRQQARAAHAAAQESPAEVPAAC
ncbi:putative transport transmembrane protein [Brachybacterium faecium]|uniref:Arabinose efflux permease family protein n=1 Tax=Brachybacterium faecium (strain ATCC 43885 / DSM 4810 / JCM 11609 / LMG 19847 / NBRC 14762 / NCIMB 9860 / 6-10) TaxID=446465 RepID=C7MHD0_BRAFD|nr:MFS transporter [Brachybacterium faecium]ACU84339.1 arabinose efflux permease family protein [Brachybacterium faecium DSM 4810]SLN01383.1 putative transport transmembrane protein [Brachybacterium faecium]HJG53219.1 MFS transporter [Brachybacterium faecium]